MNIKLTKGEKDFLLDWLVDDLHIELEKRRDQDESSPTARKYLPIIIKKLAKGSLAKWNKEKQIYE
tara:strand:+ start:625 stop:822 length:198 start_codon:yes stop_codon:yes gene_type:complete